MTKYRPEMLRASELAAQSGIDLSTIIRWAKEGKIYSERHKLRGGRKPTTLISLYSFASYVLKHYRYHKMNTRAGKWWRESDIQNPVGRTPTAIKVKRSRLKKNKKKITKSQFFS